MTTDAIEKEIRIEAPIDIVWETVTDADQMSRWFNDKTEIDLRPGGIASITWTDHGVTEQLRVQTVDKPNLFSFRWLNPQGEEPTAQNSTLVEFRLAADGDATVLRVIESGFDTIAWSDETKASAIEGHIDGWTTHTNALLRYFESDRQVSARS